MFLDLAKDSGKISADGTMVALFAKKCKTSVIAPPLY